MTDAELKALVPLPARRIVHEYNASKHYSCECWTEEAMLEWGHALVAAAKLADPLIGGCIDGGTCHHECITSDGCFRKRCCAPLSSSGLGDDWKPIPK